MKIKSKSTLGFGILVLLLGVLFFLTFWLMYIGFALLIVGTIIVLFSGQKWYYKMISIVVPIGYVAFLMRLQYQKLF